MQADQKFIINIVENPESALNLAAELFHSGKIFIYPTDTIYGIGGNPFDENVLKRISDIKGRNEKKQFIWLLSDFENLMNYVDVIYDTHLDFLQKIWPAPVTIILNLNARTKEIINQDTIAVRIPQNDFCLKLLKEISRPLISTSVNRSGEDPLKHIEQIVNNFSQDVDAIVYYSETIEKKSSTIIDLTSKQPKLIREGSIKFVELLQNFS
ncbi:MAG TPA: L-threonylcarbamoyladenylate synthase [Ignavibacteriaceae bacterium]|nr:L-threonylcarbamoyladenylate synthase [Ignavibacteriaceae bacterium]